MATVAGVGAPRGAIAAVTVAMIAVFAGVFFRPAATLAVLLAASGIALGSATPILAAVSGFSAAAYLVLRYADVVTAPTLIAAVGFTVVGVVAAVFPLRVPWLPLLAPLAAFGCYVLAARPFLGDGR